ncbi:hypothetical protein BGZ47_007056 [Haplosporangium gracile]|nr:hypothetical protein BGZ47_007056 [Haplosporangium gracile]
MKSILDKVVVVESDEAAVAYPALLDDEGNPADSISLDDGTQSFMSMLKALRGVSHQRSCVDVAKLASSAPNLERIMWIIGLGGRSASSASSYDIVIS